MRGLGLPAADPWAAWNWPAHRTFPGQDPLRRKRPATLVPGRAGPWTAWELARMAPDRPFPAPDLPSALWPAPSVAPVAVAGPPRRAGRSGTFVAKAHPCGQSTRCKRYTGPCTCSRSPRPSCAAPYGGSGRTAGAPRASGAAPARPARPATTVSCATGFGEPLYGARGPFPHGPAVLRRPEDLGALHDRGRQGAPHTGGDRGHCHRAWRRRRRPRPAHSKNAQAQVRHRR